MKIGAQLLLACVVLAAIKAAVAGLLIACCLVAAMSFLHRPRETIVVVATLSGTMAFVSHPVIVVALVAAATIVKHENDRRR